MCICFVCDKPVKDTDDFEWFGLDGDKIHKRCKPFVEKKMDKINYMNDEEFHKYLMGGKE